MRGLLVVNPRATSTSPRVIDVIVHALSDQLDLEVTITTHRGHGIALGERARDAGLDVVITLGGDGVINEVVNGMLADGPGPDVPLLGTVPGGSGNVFVRALGLPVDAVEATGLLLDRLRAGSTRRVGIGTVGDRWFVANAGLGIDAEIIEAMEEQRRRGHTATPTRYLTTTLRQYFRGTDRKEPALTLSRPGVEPVEGVFLAIVQNTAPWTYFGRWPIDPCPNASFDSGLDVFAVRRLGIPSALRAARRMVASSSAGSTRRGLEVWHDQSEFRLTARRPVSLQIDGEAIGPTTEAIFRSHPNALTVVC